jgi:hypothetical protein
MKLNFFALGIPDVLLAGYSNLREHSVFSCRYYRIKHIQDESQSRGSLYVPAIKLRVRGANPGSAAGWFFMEKPVSPPVLVLPMGKKRRGAKNLIKK